MRRIEEGKSLLEQHSEINQAHVSKGWGALYGHYIDTKQPEKIVELKEQLGSFGVFTINGAIDYLIYKENWG